MIEQTQEELRKAKYEMERDCEELTGESFVKKLHEKDYVQEDIVEIRTAFFDAEGWCADDCTILKWYYSQLQQHPTSEAFSSVAEIKAL